MPFKEIECKDVYEFWNLLDPTKPLGKKISSEQCEKLVYRGQFNAEWSLVPASLRNFQYSDAKRMSTHNAEKQVKSEFNAIRDFVNQSTFRKNIPT